MNNNDRLVRLRYALDIKDAEMVDIFKLGELEITKEEVQQLLTKVKAKQNQEDDEGYSVNEYMKKCKNTVLESFLNGLIVFKRGKQEVKPGEPIKKAEVMIRNDQSVNNVLLKKLKIALSLTSDDILGILDETGVHLSKSELSAVLRREGQRNYKECGDRYARNFLKGLAIRYRND
ncbi:Uncharacterized conserved protein YehS, DUF1456 family [Carnobacterium iners]|uniref:Uncharacterized conserved protein YehS, DUF1456 family n=1 Tax=Carnobacterium iners TaxID=1073423 RepID=A0A1X7MR93_9LACT|nr:DUF1456 family protein [Carnobacterium iners]SEL14564.1 Uncharacterized conserved protein YehS, DUF1456 family [Carnobacterium iners]SMH27342.1 Uncharacterized conserved protein YehS, DUF1456 family [Carnobacterium iners]